MTSSDGDGVSRCDTETCGKDDGTVAEDGFSPSSRGRTGTVSTESVVGEIAGSLVPAVASPDCSVVSTASSEGDCFLVSACVSDAEVACPDAASRSAFKDRLMLAARPRMVYRAEDFSSGANNIDCDCELGAVGKVEAK